MGDKGCWGVWKKSAKGVWYNPVSSRSHHRKKGWARWRLSIRILGEKTAFGPVSHPVSPLVLFYTEKTMFPFPFTLNGI